MTISCLIAGTYIVVASVMVLYGVIFHGERERIVDDPTSESMVVETEEVSLRSAMVYVPAAAHGILFLTQVESLVRAFEHPLKGESSALLSSMRGRIGYQSYGVASQRGHELIPSLDTATGADEESSSGGTGSISAVKNLREMIGDFDVRNDASMKQQINWDTEDEREE